MFYSTDFKGVKHQRYENIDFEQLFKSCLQIMVPDHAPHMGTDDILPRDTEQPSLHSSCKVASGLQYGSPNFCLGRSFSGIKSMPNVLQDQQQRNEGLPKLLLYRSWFSMNELKCWLNI